MPRFFKLFYCSLLLGLSPTVFAQIDDRGYPNEASGAGAFSFDKQESYLTSELEIPAVSERTEGPSIEVTEFQFEQLTEFPDLGITRYSVEALAESLREKYRKKTAELESGYTLEELDELSQSLPQRVDADKTVIDYSQVELEDVADYLLSISDKRGAVHLYQYQLEGFLKLLQGFSASVEVDSSLVTTELLSQLIDQLNSQQAERGLTYSELEKVAAQITHYYREKGIFLAKVYIPEQEVTEGIVKLVIMPGTLGQVIIEGNKKYSDEKLKAPFKQYIGKGVSNQQIEEALYTLNAQPGLDAYGYFSPGQNIGETELNVQVTGEKSYQITVTADNHGSVFTGDNRLFTKIDWFNPSGRGDQLAIGYMKTFDPLNSDVGVFQYRAPLWNNKAHMNFSADHNKFAIDGDASINALEISGTNSVYTLSMDYQASRLRTFGLNVGFGISQKQTETISKATQLPSPGETVQGGQVNISLDTIDQELRLLTLAQIVVQYGKFTEGVDEIFNQDDVFYKLAIDATALKFFELPFTDIESRFLLKSKWRYSESDLPAFEQLPLGGVDAVRAFSTGIISVDQAAYIGAEWYIEMPSVWDRVIGNTTFNQIFDMALFVDSAYGVQTINREGVPNTWVHLSGAGLLFQFSWKEVFTAQISFAHPLTSEVNESSGLNNFGDDADSIQTFIEFSFVYN